MCRIWHSLSKSSYWMLQNIEINIYGQKKLILRILFSQYDENWTGYFFSFWLCHYLSLSDSLRGTNCVALTDNSCSMNLQIGKYLVQIWSYILKGQKNKANIKTSCYSWLKLYLLNIDNQAFLLKMLQNMHTKLISWIPEKRLWYLSKTTQSTKAYNQGLDYMMLKTRQRRM